ncbi:MAG: peptidase prolyl oligopeptidase [Caulobacter sp.]|nr:peptidase prolyl oligopeptidase [Caulobacter sp.]
MVRLLVALGVCLAALTAAAGAAFAAPPPVEAYGRLPALDDVALSPSGARMAMIVDDGKDRSLVVTALPGGLLAKFPVGKVKIRAVSWAGEDHLMVVSTETHDFGVEYGFKHEISQVLVVDLVHGTTFFVFASGQISNAVFGLDGAAQIGGRWYGFFEGFKTSSRGGVLRSWPDLYRVDLDSGEATKVANGGDNRQDWLVGADGAVVANTDYEEASGHWRLFAGADHGRLVVETHDKLFGGGLVSEGAQPGSFIYAVTGDDGDVRYMQSAGADEGKPLSPNERIDGVILDRITGRAIGVGFDGDAPSTSFFDPAVQKRMDAVRKPFAGRRVRIVNYSGDLRRVVVFTTGPGDSGTYWMIDGAKASQIGFEYPDVQEADVGPVRMIDYKAADGLALHGVLTLPPGREAKNLPLVVLPHGGPEERDYPRFDWMAQAFAARGYAVFQPNFRGSDGYGAAFVRAGYGEWGRKMQTDVSDGMAELVRQGIVDPKRACIVGASYGGYAALAGVTVQQGVYRCAVSWGGVADPQGLLLRSAESGVANTGTRYWKRFMGAKDATSDARLKEVSPLALAGRADAPVLLLHGKDDTVVPIAQSRDMNRALKAAHRPVEYVELPEDHWLSTSQSRTEMLRQAVAFVVKHNPPD